MPFRRAAASRAVTFKNPPDFKVPADQAGDNVYAINVSASDGTSSTSEAVTVTVENEVEPVSLEDLAATLTFNEIS